MAANEYSDERKAMRAKTARLKALRLAKEAEDVAVDVVVPNREDLAGKPAKKKRMPAS